MAEDDRAPAPGVYAQDYAVTPSTATRRTSVSSADISSHDRAPTSAPANMAASQSSLQSGQGESARRPQRSLPRPVDYGSMQGSPNTPRSQLLSPQPARAPKRPDVGKRVASTAAPHRGEKFSVDDDPEEVEEDLQLARTHSRREEQRDQRDRPSRPREGTLRRRPAAAQAPALSRVESDELEGDAAQVTGNDAAAAATQAQSLADGNGDPSSEDTLQGEDEEIEEREEDVEEVEEEEEEVEEETPADEDGDADLSDTESFTLKDRQEAINETHPFGIRIWKPALYKKNRSVQRNAEGDIHSAPGGNVSRWLFVFNCLWTVIFGWWLSLLAAVGGVVNLLLAVTFNVAGCYEYGRVLINLAHYLFYPFGKYVKLERDEAYLDEDEGEGRSISEYERWQTGDLEEGRLFFGPTDINRSIIGRRRDEVEDLDHETDSLLGRRDRQPNSVAQQRARTKAKKRLFGRGKWNAGRVIFFLCFYLLIAPALFLVSGICWLLVFSIPMGKVTLLLFYHIRRHPLAMSFHTDSHYARVPSVARGSKGSAILLCTYRAVGLKYWKYTIDGTNIFLFNLLGLVVFAIFDYFVLYDALRIRTWLTSPGLVFVLALASIIPLAYFIGQAVASISAQSSMGVGATINAFFSTVVEVFLYCVALRQGKAQLVEGSIIGSIFAGILFLPGLSMCFGALKRKTQRFNVKSAGVTSTMLLFAVIGAFGPTLFYQIYGSHELNCHQCSDVGSTPGEEDRDCRRCYFAQIPAVHDRFYTQAVRPYIYFAATCLFLSYVVGLMFTLRTHAAVIWNNEPDEKKEMKIEEQGRRHEDRNGSLIPGTAGLAIHEPLATTRPTVQRLETTQTTGKESIRDSQMYKRILNQSLRQAGYAPSLAGGAPAKHDEEGAGTRADGQPLPYQVPPKSADGEIAHPKSVIPGLSAEENRALVQQVAELAATAATVAARDATKTPQRNATPIPGNRSVRVKDSKDAPFVPPAADTDLPPSAAHNPPTAEKHDEHSSGGGHDAPNWSRTKSAVILLTATLAYAVIAEILVDTVDAVLANVALDEKFLGITLFALVPNTTEFLNAISFAVNGNVALSMEIGSSYALQVMLLQMPCLVLFSAFYAGFGLHDDPKKLIDHTFTFIFPQWDMVTVILGVFLMGWVVGEGKSNYFKGSTLIFTYLVVTVGFWYSGFNDVDIKGVDPTDTLALGRKVQAFRIGSGPVVFG